MFPEVDRRLKGDRLVLLTSPSDPRRPGPAGAANEPAEAGTFALASASAVPAEPAPADARMTIPDETDAAPTQPAARRDVGVDADAAADSEAGPAVQAASVYFNIGSLGGIGTLQPWMPEASALFSTCSSDVDVTAAPAPDTGDKPGETIAPKGRVTAAHHLESPAERLGLTDEKSRAKAEKCLAEWSISKRAAKPCAARSRSRRS